jgi:chromate reductase
MYTIISGTNRIGSNTLKVAKQYQLILKEKGVEAGLLSLENVNVLTRDIHFIQMENDILIPTNRFIFIAPEYNGSFPGVLKMLFDTSKSNTIWWYKKALITGLSTGRAGNLRGNDHLSAVLNYLKITVHPNQLPISVVDRLLDEKGHFNDQDTLKAIHHQVEDFIIWSEGHKRMVG